MKKAYSKTVHLNHDEDIAIINTRTGELLDTPKLRRNLNNQSKVKFTLMGSFTRTNTKAWLYLETKVTDKELAVANKLAIRAEAYTNSLRPLNPDSTVKAIAEYLNENRKTIMRIVNKLFRLGVIGKFEIYESEMNPSKYWIFNPYLSFNGANIDLKVMNLFSGTDIAKVSDNGN